MYPVCGRSRRTGELSIKGQSISGPEMSLSGLCDHLYPQSLFHEIQAGLRLFLLLEQSRASSILECSISGSANSLSESFILLAELDHLGMDGQLRLLLGGQLCRCACICCQAGKPGHLLYHLIGWAAEVTGDWTFDSFRSGFNIPLAMKISAARPLLASTYFVSISSSMSSKSS